MDLKTLRQKLKSGDYTVRQQFDADVLLMFENCRVFNGEGSVFSATANEAQKAYEEEREKTLFLHIVDLKIAENPANNSGAGKGPSLT